MPSTASIVSAQELERHRAVQRLAYRCAEEVAAELEPGITEREAARRMRVWLEAKGVDDWLHMPFAWFGDRTAFAGFWQPLQFFPTDRRLEEGMPFILDCAPVVAGAAADIGYASSLGHNPIVEQILLDLAAHRALILELTRARRPLAEIYLEVDKLAARQGLTNRHCAYPFRVLAHRLSPLSPGRGRGTFMRFGLRTIASMGESMASAWREQWSPMWSDHRRSAHPPVPGLWAVEPHLAFRGVGAKFEELLVVTEDDAYWLDDELPHVRRWAAARGVAA